MNNNDELYTALKELANLRQVRLGDTILGFYIEELKTIPIEKIISAVKYFTTKGDRYFPSIDEFKRACGVEVKTMLSTYEKAQALVDKVRHCITRFGYAQPDNAKEYLGDDAWEIVNHFGGFVNICNTATDHNYDSMMIQIRKTAEVYLKQAAGGSQHDKIRFIEESRDLQTVSNFLPSAEETN